MALRRLGELAERCTMLVEEAARLAQHPRPASCKARGARKRLEFKLLEQVRKRECVLKAASDAVPSYASLKAFLGVAVLPGPRMALQQAPFDLLKADGKEREVRGEEFLLKLHEGGALTLGRERGVGGVFLVLGTSPQNTPFVVSLELTHVGLGSVEEVVRAVGGEASKLVAADSEKAARKALHKALLSQSPPFVLFKPQLLWPPGTAAQVEALLRVKSDLRQ